ncbi:MAG: nucleotide exchange factor GrpE [Burkholderiaceae bacterium]|nr:nucleotide exchange factor GrpE [Burkholderiaceae bacterium]
MTPDTPARTDGDLPTQQPSRDEARTNASTAPGERGAAESADRQGPVPAGAAASEPETRIAELERKLAETQERYLRAVAEVENVRRRSQEEVARAQKFGIESFAESLLPVKDSLELALAADAPDVENMKEGVGATLRLLSSAFEKNRLVEIDPQGQKFDPNLHQAISTVPAAGIQPPVAPGHVAHVLQKGYLIADRVLRPALVTVVQD